MKHIILNIFRTFILLSIITFSISSFAQEPPPPPGGSTGSTNTDGNRNGGAPIGSGLLILLGLAGTYGGYKGFTLYRKKKKTLLD